MSVQLVATTLEEFLAGSDTSSPTDRVQRIGFVLATGGVLLAAGLGALSGPLDQDDRQLLRRIALLGGLVTCFGAVVELIAWANRVDVSWIDALRSDQGTAPMMRLLGGALVVAGLSDSAREGDERPAVSLFATVGIMVGLLSFAFDGHTTSEGPRVVHALVDIVHVTAAGVWFGGVVGLAALAIRAPLDGPRAFVLHRFATTAMLAVVAVSAAGIAMAVFILDAPGDLTSTGWGQLLVLKVAIVLACVALGVYHHFGVARRIGNGDDSAALRGRARVTLLAEGMLLAAVVVVTSWLVATSPT